MISYAGVTINHPDGPAAVYSCSLLPPFDLYDFTAVSYPGEPLASLNWPSQRRKRPPRIGTLYWPQGASRFAVGYYYVTNNELAAIRRQVYSTPGVATPQLLTLNDGKRSLSTSLWMLPPRPLTQIANNNDGWLLCLVDDRYWWTKKAASILTQPGTTTWTSLYASIATALGITLGVDTIPSAYLSPPYDFTLAYDNLGILLDAVAHSVGQRITRNFAGSVQAWNAVNSAIQLAVNLNVNPPMAGGKFRIDSTNQADQPAPLPASVTVTFPSVSTVNTFSGAPAVYNVTLASLALPDFVNTYGSPSWTKILRSTLLAHYTGATPDNDAELLAYARQAATDWYRYAVAPADIVYSGVLNWTPEGLTDHLEFFHVSDTIRTRVQRPPWDQDIETVLAMGCYGSQPTGDVPDNMVIVLDTTPQTVLLSGGFVAAYKAALSVLTGDGNWTYGQPVWFLGANGETPALNWRYEAIQVNVDTSGKPIYSASLTGTTATTTTVAPASQSCQGTCFWTWSTGTQTWSLFSNGCATTTTAAPGATTTRCYPSLTTTAAPLDCNCMNPTYCGTFNGECTQTICATGLLPPIVNCTTGAPTTTTTTTQNPACTTTLSPDCGQCCWVWDGFDWQPTPGSGCTGPNCNCPGIPAALNPTCGDTICYSCVPNPPPPPPSCGGICIWTWLEPPGKWQLTGSGCVGVFLTPDCPSCACPVPTFPGTCGSKTDTPCLFQCASTTTTTCPCGYPYCGTTTTTSAPTCTGTCYWSWNGTAWTQSGNTCSGLFGACNCCPPGYNGQQTCETAVTSCNDPPFCPTTTVSPTTTTTTTTTIAPCGTCIYAFDGACNLTAVANHCTGGCGCPPIPQCPQGGGQAILNCYGTTTTTAPCGTCTYTAELFVYNGHYRGVYLLTSNTCTGGCGCCEYILPTGIPYGGETLVTNCNTVISGVSVPCPSTTTAAPAVGQCAWLYYFGNWILINFGCAAGYNCVYPLGAVGDGCCTGLLLTGCVANTTSTTTTHAPCGNCTYTWTGSYWKLSALACTGACVCHAPGSSGLTPGVTTMTPCA